VEKGGTRWLRGQVLENCKPSTATTILCLSWVTGRSHVTASRIGQDIGCVDDLSAVTELALLDCEEA
jgi:hypothetical protein